MERGLEIICIFFYNKGKCLNCFAAVCTVGLQYVLEDQSILAISGIP